MSSKKLTTLQKHQRRVQNYEDRLENCHSRTAELSKQYSEATKNISKLIREMSKTEEKIYNIIKSKEDLEFELGSLQDHFKVLQSHNKACTESDKRKYKTIQELEKKLFDCNGNVRQYQRNRQ